MRGPSNAGQHPMLRVGASDALDRGSPHSLTALFVEGLINSFWPALGCSSWHFYILDILVSLNKHLSLISFID